MKKKQAQPHLCTISKVGLGKGISTLRICISPLYFYPMLKYLIALTTLVALIGVYSLLHTRNSSPAGDTIACMALDLTSPSFKNGQSIPSQYTCERHRNTNPPLEITGTPAKAVSLTILMDDPDVPKTLKPDGIFDHFVLFNIPPATTAIPETNDPQQYPGVVGANGAGQKQYTGPCPPKEYEPSEHRYVFRVYALDTMLNLQGGATKTEVLQAMEGHTLEWAELVGKYQKTR